MRRRRNHTSGGDGIGGVCRRFITAIIEAWPFSQESEAVSFIIIFSIVDFAPIFDSVIAYSFFIIYFLNTVLFPCFLALP